MGSEQNGWDYADNIFAWFFLIKHRISIEIYLKFLRVQVKRIQQVLNKITDNSNSVKWNHLI